MELREAARGRWRDLLPAVGVPSGFMSGKHQPCPLCGGKDRARFDDRDGRGTWICSQCGAGDGFDLVMKLRNTDFRGAVEMIKPLIPTARIVRPRPARSDDDRRGAMNRLWREAAPVAAGDPVATYLTRRCGISAFPPALRTASRAVYHADDGAVSHHPAMVAMVLGADGKPVNLHRTYLTLDGEKADVPDCRRLMPGELPVGSAIRLFPAAAEMGIAEGIETAFAAASIFGMPVWAAISAGNLAKWTPPEGTKRLVVFGDNDMNFTGQAVAYALARAVAIKRAVKSIDVRIPPYPDRDWLDMLDMKRVAA